jgi:hypothetical protein
LLAALSPIGFIGAFASKRWFGGKLSDPHGIPPARVRLLGAVREIDLNLVAVIGVLVSLGAMLWIYHG